MAKVNRPDAHYTPLNAAQERQIRALFQAVMDDNIVLIRSFAGDSAGSYVLSKNVNRVTEKHPELLKTAVSMMLYPAIKWMLQAKDIDALIRACECMDTNSIDAADIQRLREIQTWLSPYVDRDAVHFRRRDLYFRTCEKLVSTIQNVRQELHFENHYTQAMGDIYDCFLDPQKLVYNNRHKIVQYCERCIELTYNIAGEDIEECYERLMEPVDMDGVEEASLYHNVPQLLTEYARILWRAKRSLDPAMKMLSTASYEELVHSANHTSGRIHDEAYILVEYVKIIRGAVEMLKSFPGGVAYYDIISAIIEGKKDCKKDAEIARQLGISPGPYSSKKAHAIGVFGCILWGCDVTSLLNCLIDHRV